MDLSKAFHCVNNELLITKLHAYEVYLSWLKLAHNYLNIKKQKVRIDNSFNTVLKLEQGFSQGLLEGRPFSNYHQAKW